MRLNISIDDVSPHKRIGFEAVHRISELISEFPTIKISLFVPTSIRRFRDREKIAYRLDHYPKFVDKLIALPADNFEICYHGHHHGNKKLRKNNDELRYSSEEEAIHILTESQKMFNSVGIIPQPVLRLRGFWISPKSFEACRKFGIKVLALNRASRYRRWYKGEDRKYKHVVYVGRQPNKTSDKEIYYHAGVVQKDFFGKRQCKDLRKMLHRTEVLSFIFMEGFYGKD